MYSQNGSQIIIVIIPLNIYIYYINKPVLYKSFIPIRGNTTTIKNKYIYHHGIVNILPNFDLNWFRIYLKNR